MPAVRTNGVETYYERRGDGPPIVFVHGMLSDHAAWTPQLERLADDRATLAYGVRGHGRTGASSIPSYSIDLFADDLRALLESVALDRPVVCGLSMGGMIAQAYAAAHPDRVAGLVLADTFVPDLLTRGDWFLRRVVLGGLAWPIRLLGYERVEAANAWLTERIAPGSSGDYERIRRLHETAPTMDTDEVAKVLRAVATFHESSIDLPAIDVPTLVLYGENELPIVKRHGLELAARLPDVEVDDVPNAGHESNLDNPAYFTAAVREFLDRAGTDGYSTN